MSIEERLRRLEDRAAINDLVVNYFLAADGDNLDGVGASFTEDATFSASGAVSATGRRGVVDFIRTARGHMGLTIHTPHYAQLSFEGDDTAHGLVGAHLELVLGDDALLGAVRYADRYVRAGNQWLISARDMRTIYIAPWSQVGDAFSSDAPVRWPGAVASVSDFPRKTT